MMLSLSAQMAAVSNPRIENLDLARPADPDNEAHVFCPRCQPPDLMKVSDRIVALCGYERIYNGERPLAPGEKRECRYCLVTERVSMNGCSRCPA